MPRFLLIVIPLSLLPLAGCSAPGARASTDAPAPATPAIKSPEPSAPKRPTKADEDEAPGKVVLSELTGIRLEPAAQVGRMNDQGDQLLSKILGDLKITCERLESYGIAARPKFRQTDAIGRQIMNDAREIGWKLAPKKLWADASVLDGLWHGTHIYMVMTYSPGLVAVGFCKPPPPPEKGKKK